LAFFSLCSSQKAILFFFCSSGGSVLLSFFCGVQPLSASLLVIVRRPIFIASLLGKASWTILESTPQPDRRNNRQGGYIRSNNKRMDHLVGTSGNSQQREKQKSEKNISKIWKFASENLAVELSRRSSSTSYLLLSLWLWFLGAFPFCLSCL
jgi:hypothetical protein